MGGGEGGSGGLHNITLLTWVMGRGHRAEPKPKAKA